MLSTNMSIESIDSLEKYATALTLTLISIQTLCNYQIKAIKCGILKEDLECRTQTIIWDYKRMIHIVQEQLTSVLELLPDDFKIDDVINQLKKEADLPIKKTRKKK